MKPALLFLACLCVLVPGCGLYSRSSPGPDAGFCRGTAAAWNLRDPWTGQCVASSTCDPDCGGCPPNAVNTGNSSWGACTSQCTGLDESTCLATAGCRAAYIDTGEAIAPGGDRQTKQFYGCWATDQTGPIEGGGCYGLDAYDCSRHDDCTATYASTCAPGTQPDPASCLGNFESCAPEAATGTGDCATDADCGPGSYCNTSTCLPPPDCPPGAFCTTCDGMCEPDPDPGSCTGEVTCPAGPPPCPSGTVPGIADGCYTGYCIPKDQCAPPPACDTITDEATCIGRSDCSPIYEGQNCSCDASGACACQTWVFTSCETAAPAPPPLPPVDGGAAAPAPQTLTPAP